MIAPSEIWLGAHPFTRVALRSQDETACQIRKALRAAWKQHEVQANQVYYVPMPQCPEKVLVDLSWSRPTEQSVCVYTEQFESFFLIRGSMHPLASSALLTLLTMIKDAIGPLIESCRVVVDDEIDPIPSGDDHTSILVYSYVASTLAHRHTVTDLISAMGDPVARVLWEHLRIA